VQLGRGNIELGQELPLETSEREPEPNLLEYGCIDEAERVAIVAIVISTERFPRRTRTNGNLIVMLLMKGKMGLISQMVNSGLSIDRGSLIQQGWRSPWVQQFIVRNGAYNGIGLWGG